MKKVMTDFCIELLNKSFDEYDELKAQLELFSRNTDLAILGGMSDITEEYIEEIEEKIRKKEEFYAEFLKQIIGRN